MKTLSPPLPGHPVAEFELGHGIPGFEPVPVVRLDEHTFVSRHRLAPEDLAELNRTGELYVLHGSDGRKLLPVRLQVTPPEFTMPVLVVGLPGGGRAVCHGLEVVEAGGKESDRQDCAAAEAAELVVAGAALPARVALLKADIAWMDAGGETCATRAQLENALVLRLKKALAEGGGKRVESRCGEGSVFTVQVEERSPREFAEAVAAAGD